MSLCEPGVRMKSTYSVVKWSIDKDGDRGAIELRSDVEEKALTPLVVKIERVNTRHSCASRVFSPASRPK